MTESKISDIIETKLLTEEVRCTGKFWDSKKSQYRKCNTLFFEHEIYYGTVIVKCHKCNKVNKFTYNALDI